MKNIIYAGDSFVWGEGLELYIDSPYWISERELHNEWIGIDGGLGLIDKQTPETHEFRTKNRYAGIIEREYGYKQIVDSTNGGDFQSAIEIVQNNFTKSNIIVYLFTSIDRNFLHFRRDCPCLFCSDYKPKPFNLYVDYLNKILSDEPIDEWTRGKIDYLVEHEGIPKFDLNEFERQSKHGDLVPYIDSLFAKHRKQNMEAQIAVFKSWIKTHKVFLIDSWCNYTSNNYIENNEYLQSLMIPLKGYDGNFYKDYSQWEETFLFKRIDKEFPLTKNGHPTLIQHQYLAESIITAINQETKSIL